MNMTCIKYREYKDIDVKFEDGVIVKHKSWFDFQNGFIAHPLINQHYYGELNGISLMGIAWRNGRKAYYYCRCPQCNYSDILTPQEILNHICKTDDGGKMNVDTRKVGKAETIQIA